MPQQARATPSFHPLYESDRSRRFPESPDWHTRTEAGTSGWSGSPVGVGADWLGWADVLVDFRLPTARTPLPPVLPGDPITWDSADTGWALHGWAFTPEDAPEDADGLVDAVSVARFTDPDGFRFAFVVSQDKPGQDPSFAAGRFSFLLPTMRLVFLHGGDRRTPGSGSTTWGDGSVPLRLDGFTHPSHTYSLTRLRDAVRDPHRWLSGAHARYATGADDASHDETLHGVFPGPFGPLAATRVLLAWASAGATCYPEAADWVAAGLDPAEAAGWADLNDPEVNKAGRDPETGQIAQPWSHDDIVAWHTALGGGRKRRSLAVRGRAAGLTAEQTGRWQEHLSAAPVKNRPTILSLEAAGWTPADVTMVQAALVAAARRDPDPVAWWGTPTLAEVAEWSFLSPTGAVAYLDAGFGHAESRALVEAGQAPDAATLAMMAALRPARPVADRVF